MENCNLTAVRFRPPKAERLLQINQLALDGHSGREIGRRLGLGKSSVNRWLEKLRAERRTNVADPAETIAYAVARCDAIYREAMEAWRRSQAEKQVRLVEETDTSGERGGSKKKTSVRNESRAGEVAYLAAARDTVLAICKLVPGAAPGQSKAAGPVFGPFDLNTMKREDLRNMSEAELVALEAQLEAQIAAEEARMRDEAKLTNAAETPKPK